MAKSISIASPNTILSSSHRPPFSRPSLFLQPFNPSRCPLSLSSSPSFHLPSNKKHGRSCFVARSSLDDAEHSSAEEAIPIEKSMSSFDSLIGWLVSFFPFRPIQGLGFLILFFFFSFLRKKRFYFYFFIHGLAGFPAFPTVLDINQIRDILPHR